MVAASFSTPRQEATAGLCDWPRSPSPPPPPAPRQAPKARASRPVESLGFRAAHPLSLLGQSRSSAVRGLGQQSGESEKGSVPASPPRERLVPESQGATTFWTFCFCLLLSIPLKLSIRTPGPSPLQRHGRIFATRQI